MCWAKLNSVLVHLFWSEIFSYYLSGCLGQSIIILPFIFQFSFAGLKESSEIPVFLASSLCTNSTGGSFTSSNDSTEHWLVLSPINFWLTFLSEFHFTVGFSDASVLNLVFCATDLIQASLMLQEPPKRQCLRTVLIYVKEFLINSLE